MSCIGSGKIISRRDIEQEKYELYYLMNFTQLPPEQQPEYFYIKNIDPAYAEKHYDAVCLDAEIDGFMENSGLNCADGVGAF